MLTISQAINQGVEFHRRGDLDRAEQLYRQVLEANARHADAWHLLGLIAHVRGKSAEALEYIGRAIQLDPNQPSYYNHQGEVYRTLSRLAEAEQSCREALRLKPDFAIAFNTLGMVQTVQGRCADAAASFRQALEIDPRFAVAYTGLGAALHGMGQLNDAVAACRQAVAIDPRQAIAYKQLGSILREQGKVTEAIEAYRKLLAIDPKSASAECNLGALLQATSQTEEAIACYRRALAIDPQLANAHSNLGNALRELGQLNEAALAYQNALKCNPHFGEAHYNLGVLLQGQGENEAAIECYQKAIHFKPDCAPAHNNLGMLYRNRGDLAGAKDCYAKALEYEPDFAEALNNLGNLLKLEGRIDEAVVCYRQTLKLQPANAQARCNLAMVRLAAGNFAAAWPGYEFRRGCPEYRERSFDKPQWRGEPLAGRRLLIHAEQGLGDTLQFARFVPLVAEQDASVIFEVQPALVPLIEQSGLARAGQLIARGDSLPEFDLYVPLLSLPGILGTQLDSIPATRGYLSADPKLIDSWRDVLGGRPPLRVGIAWQGSTFVAFDRYRSIPLVQFAPLAIDGVELVSLQKGFGTEQLADCGFAVRELGPDFDESHGAFMDTAAVMTNLDLVITSDTSTAHLAGALGVQTWVALMSMPDWRWMHERTDSPWYASLRLFRQTELGDWPGVFERIAESLRQLVGER